MAVRKVDAFLTINGQRYSVEEMTVTRSRLKSASTFTAKGPLISPNFPATFWANAATLTNVAVMIAAVSGGTQMLMADCDKIDIDWDHLCVEIGGRDHTAKLIDKKTTEAHLNKKSSEVVQKYASDAGMTVDSTTTQLLAGRIYQIDYNKLTNHESPWTIIQRLADYEGFTATVDQNNVLSFKNMTDDQGSISIHYTLPTADEIASGNFVSLRTVRNLQAAKTIKVNVMAFNSKQNKVVTSDATVNSSGDASDVRQYNYVHNDLTQDQADAISKKRANEAASHEMSIDLSNLPGDETMTPQMSLVFTGTGTDVDQTYQIDTIEDSVSFEGGYASHITGKSMSSKRSAAQ